MQKCFKLFPDDIKKQHENQTNVQKKFKHIFTAVNGNAALVAIFGCEGTKLTFIVSCFLSFWVSRSQARKCCRINSLLYLLQLISFDVNECYQLILNLKVDQRCISNTIQCLK